MDYRLRRKVERFEKAELEKLGKLTTKELLKLPKTLELTPPTSLIGQRFSITRDRIAKATYEISVRYHIPPNPELYAEIEAGMAAMGIPDVKIGPGTSRLWFWIDPNGRKHWPKFVHDPDD